MSYPAFLDDIPAVSPTTVASLKGRIRDLGPSLEHAPADYHYVGRRMTMGGWRLPASPFANPFSVKEHGAGRAVELYGEWFADRPVLRAQAERDLAGATLLCWCGAGRPCHAVWLAERLSGTVAWPVSPAQSMYSAAVRVRQERDTVDRVLAARSECGDEWFSKPVRQRRDEETVRLAPGMRGLL